MLSSTANRLAVDAIDRLVDGDGDAGSTRAAANDVKDNRCDGDNASTESEEYVMMPLPAPLPENNANDLSSSASTATTTTAASSTLIPDLDPLMHDQIAFTFDYVGSLGNCVDMEHSVFRICVLQDGALVGEVLQLQTLSSNSSNNNNADTQEHASKRRKLPSSTATNSSTASSSTPIERTQWVETAQMQGRATPLRPHHRYHEPLRDDDLYCCYFDVLPARADATSDSAIACHVHWTPRTPRLSGHALAHCNKPFWITLDAPCELLVQELTATFQWTKRNANSAPMTTSTSTSKSDHHSDTKATSIKSESEHELFPLTSGLFEFRGFTTTDAPSQQQPTAVSLTQQQRRRQGGRRTPRRPLAPPSTPIEPVRDECFVTLQLLPDGTLRGSSRELLRPQSCPLEGSWRADRIKYVLAYTVRDAVGRFKYTGRIDRARRAVVGRWRNVDDHHAEGFAGGRGAFELTLTDAARLPLPVAEDDDDDAGNASVEQALLAITQLRIRVLTTGAFTLRGCATDDDGYEYACELFVQLLPGGELQGSVRERIFDQTRTVRGHWTPHALSFTQVYVVKNDVGEYVYTGTLDDDGATLRGAWRNADAHDAAAARSERGVFAFGVVYAQRQWSPFSHKHYPLVFRTGVRTVLLSAARTHVLPIALWCRVLSFCNELWFA